MKTEFNFKDVGRPRLAKAWLLAASVAFLTGADAGAAEIKGAAHDASGGVLVGARITLVQLASGAESTTLTDASGLFSFASVAPGPCRVSAQLDGFSGSAQVVAVSSETEALELDFELRLGQLQAAITVTAIRNVRDELVVPLRAERLGQDQLESVNPAGIGDLMVEAPGITPVSNGPFQVRPRLRGLDSTRVLVLVDGERLNNARTATDRAGAEVGLVDVGSVESVEVVSGSGSVLYGTDALSGTINILTKQPGFSDKTRFTAGLSSYYSTNEKGARGNLTAGVTGPRYAVSVSGGLESFDNYASGGKDGETLEDTRPLYASGTLKQQDTIDTNFPPFAFKAFPDPFNAPFVRTQTEIPTSGFDGESLGANALFAISDKQQLRLKYFHREAEDVGFPDFVPPQFFQGIVLPFSKLDKVSARYQVRQLNSWWSSLTATLYYQRQDRLLRNLNVPVQFPAPTAVAFFPINVFRLTINSETEQKVKTPGLDVQSTFLLSPRNVLTAGLTAYQDESADRRLSSTQTSLVGNVSLGARGPQANVFPALMPLGPPSVTNPSRVPNAKFRDLAAFAEDEWEITRKVRLVAGLRVDSYRVATDPTPGYDIQTVVAGTRPPIDPSTLPSPNGEEISRTALTGDLGLIVRATDKLSLVGHYGRSYRHANLEELLFAGPATVGSIAPNITVEPEEGDNIDLGAKYRSSRVRGSLSYFNNKYHGFISTEITALTASSSVSQAINFADVRIQGVEADIETPFSVGGSVVTVFANGAYNKGTVLEGRNPLTGASIAGTPQDNITPFKAIAGLRVTDKKDRFWAQYSFRHQKEVERVATTLKDSPFLIYQDLAGLNGFTIHRIGLGVELRRNSQSIGLSVGVENLANKFYREQFQFAPARGRSVTFGLRVGRS